MKQNRRTVYLSIVAILIYSFNIPINADDEKVDVIGKVKTNTLEIGQKYGGGIIAYVDETGNNGLIAATKDQSDSATWKQAKALCKKYRGGGYSDWHLPTLDELNLLYENLYQERLGGFAADTYWCSSEYCAGYVWNQDFKYGSQDSLNDMSSNNRVRAVRAFSLNGKETVPKEKSMEWGEFEIGQKYGGGIIAYVDETGKHGLIAAMIDQSDGVDWVNAISICKKYKSGGYSDWHLPTLDELNLLYENLYKKGLGSFAVAIYWSSSEYGAEDGCAWEQYFYNGRQSYAYKVTNGKGNYLRVRAVRNF